MWTSVFNSPTAWHPWAETQSETSFFQRLTTSVFLHKHFLYTHLDRGRGGGGGRSRDWRCWAFPWRRERQSDKYSKVFSFDGVGPDADARVSLQAYFIWRGKKKEREKKNTVPAGSVAITYKKIERGHRSPRSFAVEEPNGHGDCTSLTFQEGADRLTVVRRHRAGALHYGSYSYCQPNFPSGWASIFIYLFFYSRFSILYTM